MTGKKGKKNWELSWRNFKETVVDMLSEEEEDEEIDRADVGSDNDTDLDMVWTFSQTVGRQATGH